MLANGTAVVPATVAANGRLDPERLEYLKTLGRRVCQTRTAKGMTQADLGDHLQIHGSAVSRLERGEYYSATPYLIARIERFLKLASKDGYEPWFIDWLQVEETACKLRTWEPLVIPGLFQTRSYARCALRGAFQLRPQREIHQMAEARLDRQVIWDRKRPDPPLMPVVIGEAALRRELGGTDVMLEQLARLLEMAGHDRITVQVLELSSRGFVGQLAPFVIASFDDGHPDVVHLDNAVSGMTTPEPEMVSVLTEQYDALAQNALGPADSADLIRKVMGGWTK